MRDRLLSSVFTKAIRDALQWTVIAIIAVWLMALMMIFVFGSFGEEYAALMRDMPEALAAVYGQNDGTPAGIAMSSMFALMAPIVLLAYAVGLGSGAAVGEEEARTLPLLLANPLRRAGIVTAKIVVVVIGVVVITLATWLAIEVSAALVGMDLSNQNVVAASIQLLGLALLFGGLAAGLSAWRGSSGLGIGVAAVIAVASYFISTLLPVVDELAEVARLTPWFLYSGADALNDGIDLLLLGIAIGMAGLLLWAGLFALQRRDLKG